jgi:hypothetical protein
MRLVRASIIFLSSICMVPFHGMDKLGKQQLQLNEKKKELSDRLMTVHASLFFPLPRDKKEELHAMHDQIFANICHLENINNQEKIKY